MSKPVQIRTAWDRWQLLPSGLWQNKDRYSSRALAQPPGTAYKAGQVIRSNGPYGDGWRRFVTDTGYIACDHIGRPLAGANIHDLPSASDDDVVTGWFDADAGFIARRDIPNCFDRFGQKRGLAALKKHQQDPQPRLRTIQLFAETCPGFRPHYIASIGSSAWHGRDRILAALDAVIPQLAAGEVPRSPDVPPPFNQLSVFVDPQPSASLWAALNRSTALLAFVPGNHVVSNEIEASGVWRLDPQGRTAPGRIAQLDEPTGARVTRTLSLSRPPRYDDLLTLLAAGDLPAAA